MLRLVAAIAAQDPIDPATLRPSPLSSVAFVFLLVATVLLLLSMRRHLGRARANLGSARDVPPASAALDAASERVARDVPAGRGAPDDPEDGSR
jgi:hypothetical protein